MPPTAETLVVGYGSDLRGDDAVGRHVAERVRAWSLPHVHVISAHQLTPDLAAHLATVGRVFFIDAQAAVAGPRRRMRRLRPVLSPTHLGHSGAPQSLLAWTCIAYGASPDAWWITLPAHTFDLGAGLSSATEEAMQDALPAIRRLLEEPAPDASVHGTAGEDRPGRPTEGPQYDD